jgi:hypothetical protein
MQLIVHFPFSCPVKLTHLKMWVHIEDVGQKVRNRLKIIIRICFGIIFKKKFILS